MRNYLVYALFLGLLWGSLLPGRHAEAANTLLQVSEQTATGITVNEGCKPGATHCSTDIDSTLTITPNLSSLLQAETPSTVQTMKDIQLRQQTLNEALAAYNKSVDSSIQLVARYNELAAKDLQTQAERELASLSKEFEAQRRSFYTAVISFLRLDPQHYGITTSPDSPNFDLDALMAIKVYYDNDSIPRWIANELKALDGEATAATEALKSAAQRYSLRMGAFRTRTGGESIPVHLPNYDDYANRSLSSVERFPTSLSSEGRQALADQIAVANRSIDLITNLKGELEKFRQQAQMFRDELRSREDRLQALDDQLKQGLAALQSTLAATLRQLKTAPDLVAVRDALQELQASTQVLEGQRTAFRTTLQQMKATLSTTDPSLANRPDLILLGLLDGVQGFRDTLAKFPDELKAFEKAAQQVQQTTDTWLATHGQEALATVLNNLKTELQQNLTPPVSTLTNLVKGLADTLGGGEFGQFLRELGNGSAQSLADLQLSPDHSFEVSGDQLVETQLVVRRTDPQPGDVLEIVAEVREMQTQKLVREERTAADVNFYGWSSSVSGGLIFIKADKTALANFEPAPAANWKISYLPRPGEKNLGSLRPGIGMHIATLDFDPNNTVEIGTGVSVHLFGNLLQAGYGWNLGVEEDRGYWFLGLGLYDFFKQNF